MKGIVICFHYLDTSLCLHFASLTTFCTLLLHSQSFSLGGSFSTEFESFSMIFLAIGSQETAYPTYLKIKYKALFQNPTLGVFLEFLNPAGSLKSGAFFCLGRFFAPLGCLGCLGCQGCQVAWPGWPGWVARVPGLRREEVQPGSP